MEAKTIRYIIYCLYTSTLIYLVFISGDDHRHLNPFSLDNHVNLVPGKEKYHFFTHEELWYGWNRRFYIKEIIANFLLLAPVPFFLVWGEGWRRGGKVILFALGISFSIEFTQFILGIGSADIDDLMLNTSGAAVATLFAIKLKKSTFWPRVQSIFQLPA